MNSRPRELKLAAGRVLTPQVGVQCSTETVGTKVNTTELPIGKIRHMLDMHISVQAWNVLGFSKVSLQ